VCENPNWKDKVKKCKTILYLWSKRNRTLQGQTNVVSTFRLSRLWYVLAVQHMPDWAYDELKVVCLRLIWNYGSHLVAYAAPINDKDKGGLKIPDIRLKMYALRLKFAKRFVDEICTAIWKDLFCIFSY
jgi:hypothetical protein